MSKNLLHKTKLDDFKNWLTAKGINHRDGKGLYEVLQVECGAGWAAVYERNHMPEHFSTDKRIDSLVQRFCIENRQK